MERSRHGAAAGTAVPVVCDHASCTTGIRRDVAHRCGGAGFDGCGRHCCAAHLITVEGVRGAQCPACAAHHLGVAAQTGSSPALYAVPPMLATPTAGGVAAGVA